MAVGLPAAARTGMSRPTRMVPRHAARFDPRRFGRRPRVRPQLEGTPARLIASDLRLFAVTFAAGFLFVTVMIA